MKADEDWRCECPDHKYREVECKHIFAVKLSLTLRRQVASSDEVFELIKENVVSECVVCGSRDIMRHGTGKNRKGAKQRFRCKGCGHTFVEKDEALENIKNDPKVVTLALDLYFKGISLRKIPITSNSSTESL
ncbi:MAG: hypothetical protein GTN80_07120 [Nitrososphaeria archaeon]|nr:hypothetical protein [Nitrososphaeria archaeon]